MWTIKNRHRYDRDQLRYPSDLTDAEWRHIEPLIPSAKRGGGKTHRQHARGGQRGDVRAEHRLPVALYPEGPTAAQHGDGYLCQWGWDGTLEKMHHALYVKCREHAEREASPTVCILDSQSVKSAEKGGFGPTRMASMPAS